MKKEKERESSKEKESKSLKEKENESENTEEEEEEGESFRETLRIIFDKPYRVGLSALFHKEMADHVRSKRFFIVMGLIWLTCFAGLYGALGGLNDVVTDDSRFAFLMLFTTSGRSIPSFTAFIALLGPFVGLALGFDAINGERSKGTLNRLLAHPIYRDAVITGKFLAGAAIISIMVLAMGIIMAAAGTIATGLIPSGEEIARLLSALVLTCFYIAFWLGLATLFSVICNHAATSALATIACWLFLAVFVSMIAGIVAGAAFPVDGPDAAANAVSNFNLERMLSRLSPHYLYSESITAILTPSVRTTGAITMEQIQGALHGYLPFGQSLLLIWPQTIAMIAFTVLSFGISFVCFMRQEVR